jgi:hypothetical protein
MRSYSQWENVALGLNPIMILVANAWSCWQTPRGQAVIIKPRG